MNTLLANTLIATAGIIRGTLASAFNYLNTLIKSGTQGAMQFHQEGIAFAREMGMNAKEAQAYTEVLTDRTERLAMKYGVAAEQVKELQRNISVATSRQLMLNESQAEGFLQLNKLVGSSTVTKFTEEMMNGMGGQLDSVQGAVSKAYASAAKSGLNAQKVSEKIANNLNMANKLSFRTGIEGLTRMAIQAEKVGLSLNSVESAANAFMEIDDAIEASARLNMLGGQFGMFGGNPLDMAYEANADPEALMERITKMAQGAAKFDVQKGYATVDPVMMDMLRNAAKAMGMSPDELVGSAKKQASNAYKESHINSAYKNMGLTKEQIDFLINKSDVKDGKVMFTTKGGEKVDLGKSGQVSKEVIEEMMKYQGMSDRDIMEENARSLSSINEILTGIKDSITAMFAKFIEGLFPDIQKDVKDLGGWFKGKLEPIAKDIGESARSAYNWIKENKELIKTAASGLIGFIKGFTSLITPVLNFAKDWPKTSAAIIAAIWGAKALGKMGLGRGIGRGARGAARSGGGRLLGKIGRGLVKAFKSGGSALKKAAIAAGKSLTKGAIAGARGLNNLLTKGKHSHTLKQAWGTAKGTFKRTGGSTVRQLLHGGKALWNNSRLVRGLARGGGIGIAGMAGNYVTDKMAESGTISKGGVAHSALKAVSTGAEYAALGATIGSIIPGIGTGIGAGAGFIAGAIKGLYDAQKSKGEAAEAANSSLNKTNFDEGGAVGGAKGKPYQVTVHGGEGVITPQQFNSVFGDTVVKPKPLGENPEYIYKPNRSETSNVNGNTITVKDFNINISGTLRLDAGNYSKSIDGRELLNDYAFMTQIKNMIKESINRDINGGKYLSDLATMANFPAQTGLYGKG